MWDFRLQYALRYSLFDWYYFFCFSLTHTRASTTKLLLLLNTITTCHSGMRRRHTFLLQLDRALLSCSGRGFFFAQHTLGLVEYHTFHEYWLYWCSKLLGCRWPVRSPEPIKIGQIARSKYTHRRWPLVGSIATIGANQASSSKIAEPSFG